jgi:EmrB/QacA subfamily drug resistance transporter
MVGGVIGLPRAGLLEEAPDEDPPLTPRERVDHARARIPGLRAGRTTRLRDVGMAANDEVGHMAAMVEPSSASRTVDRRALGGLALVVVLSAQLVVTLDFSIVNVALPSISRDLLVSATSVQWVVTAYAITFGGLLVLGGRVADLFGRRRMFVAGLIGFAVASMAGGVATTFPMLVAARAAQGIAAAAVAPAALSILTTTFADGPARTRVLGYYGVMASVGFVLGLVLGGLLVETVDWRGVFFVNVPICLLGAALGARLLPRSVATRRPPHLDLAGASLVTGGVAVLVYAPTAAADNGWTSAPFLAALAVSTGLLVAFLHRERRSPQPLMPLSIFRSGTLAAGDAVTLLVGAWIAGEVLVLTLYLQQVRGFSPLVAGLIVLPQGVGGLLRGAVGPAVVARLGVRRFLAGSAALSAIGLGLLLRIPATSQEPLLELVLLVVGFGSTCTLFAATVAGSAGVRNGEQGLASGLINMSRQVGSAVGVAVLLAVAAAITSAGGGSPTAVADGYRQAMGVTAALAVIATVISIRYVRDGVSRAHHERLRRRHLDHPWPLPGLLASAPDTVDAA